MVSHENRIKIYHELTSADLMLVTDNVTRWNSAFMSIRRALLLRPRLDLLIQTFYDDLDQDALSQADWEVLGHLEKLLAPFFSVTKHLEGQAKEGHHGSVWEALPAIEALIEHLDQMKQEYSRETYPELATSINLAWAKLDDYCKKLDNSSAYAAAVILHPEYKLKYFENRWNPRPNLKPYLAPMKKSVTKIYNQRYRQLEPTLSVEQEEEEPHPYPNADLKFFSEFMKKNKPRTTPTEIKQPWKYYSEGDPEEREIENLFTWWSDQHHIPSVQQMAYDHISIPAMSAETERVFSETKHIIPDVRRRLGATTIEAQECSKRWKQAGI